MYDITHQAPDAEALFALASAQAGYFTSAQARDCGYDWRLLSYHTSSGRFIRVRRGLYRLRDYPSTPREEILAAWLAVGKEDTAVSHESALELLGLSDVVPSTIHLLVPRARRGLPAMPGVTLHTTTRPLSPREVVTRQGMHVTAPIRTILDVAEAGTAPEQVIKAVEQAGERGMLLPASLCQAAQLRTARVAQLIDQAVRGGC